MTDSSNRDERIDDLASRLLDRDIEFADVPADLRSAVQSRADAFARHREIVLRVDDVDERSLDDAIARAIDPPRASRFRSSLLGAAAAAITLVVALGVVVSSRSGGDDPMADVADLPSTPVVAAEAAPDAASKSQAEVASVPDSVLATPMQTPSVADAGSSSPVTSIADMVAFGDIAREWSITSPALSDQPSVCALAPGSRLVDGSFAFAGLDAEIHYGDTEIVVFSLSDCTKMASIAR